MSDRSAPPFEPAGVVHRGSYHFPPLAPDQLRQLADIIRGQRPRVSLQLLISERLASTVIADGLDTLADAMDLPTPPPFDLAAAKRKSVALRDQIDELKGQAA